MVKVTRGRWSQGQYDNQKNNGVDYPSLPDAYQRRCQEVIPTTSSLTTNSGRSISYESPIVANGLQINCNAIPALSNALEDLLRASALSTRTPQQTKPGLTSRHFSPALPFLHNQPQNIMWMTWDRLRQTRPGDKGQISFYTGMPTMFSVPKHSQALDEMRIQRGIGGNFEHNLVFVDSANRKATFKKGDGSTVDVDCYFLHAVPPTGPLDDIKGQPISDEAG